MSDFRLHLTEEQFDELAQFWHEYMVLGPRREEMGLDRSGIALNFSQWIDSDPDEEPEYGLPEIIAFFNEKERREGTAFPRNSCSILMDESTNYIEGPLKQEGEHHMQEDDTRVYTLVASRNPGRYALDEQDGGDVTTGQPLAIVLGGRWTLGRVEHSNYPSQKYPDAAGCYALTGMQQVRIGYYFVATGGLVCGLCTGMQVRLSEPTARE